MLSLRSRLGLHRDRGASAVEYAVLLGAVAAVVVFAVFGLGGRVTSLFSATASCIDAQGLCTQSVDVAPPAAAATPTPTAAPTTAAPAPAPSSTRNNGDGNGDGKGNGNCGKDGGSGNGRGNSCNKD